jgi:hypothetical protein
MNPINPEPIIPISKRIQLTQNCQESFFGGGQIRRFGKNILITIPKNSKKSTKRIKTNNTDAIN